MSNEIDYSNLPNSPEARREAERDRRAVRNGTQSAYAFVGARTGREILAYENDEDDLLVNVLFGYAKLAGVQSENLIYDDRDLWFGHRHN